MMGFLVQAIKHFSTIGAIDTFSSYTIAKTRNHIVGTHPQRLLELGSGTGTFTRGLLNLLPEEGELRACEINPYFHEALTHIADKRIRLITTCASTVLDYVATGSIDCVVSTLPLTLFNDRLTKSILGSAQEALKPGGIFVIIQYSSLKEKIIYHSLNTCSLKTYSREFRNMPPALIYVFEKHSVDALYSSSC